VVAAVIDPRNRPAVVGACLAGLAAFVTLALLGLSPVVAWMAGWSVPAFAIYGVDKGQARTGGWRIPEAVLHGLALVGGVVGAWAGRAVFRHKTQRPVFLVILVVASVIWSVVLVAAIVR
jgi:uncharacterized membrane protein YsdA (DUF1294 family)